MSDPMEATVNWLCSLAREGIKPKEMTITLPKEDWLRFAAFAVDTSFSVSDLPHRLEFHGPCGVVHIRSAE